MDRTRRRTARQALHDERRVMEWSMCDDVVQRTNQALLDKRRVMEWNMM